MTLPDHARCRCGEHLVAGERAGSDTATGHVVCLWCIADRQAGRTPPRRRAATAPPMAAVAPTPARTSRPRRRAARALRPRQRRAPGTALTLVIVAVVLVGAAYLDNAVLGHDSVLRAFGINQ